MTNPSKPTLVNLPNDTKELVNEGVFSLYSLAQDDASRLNASFVLYTRTNIFLLNDDGDVVVSSVNPSDFKTIAAISFPEIPQRSSGTSNFYRRYIG